MYKRFKKLDAITQSQTLLIMGIVFLVLFALLAYPFYNSCKQEIAVTKLRTLYTQLIDASHRAFISSMTNMNEFDTSMPIDKFAQVYFTSQLPVEKYCIEKQDACWNSVQYSDLRNSLYDNKITYSVELSGGTVLGFSKNANNQITLIADINGKLGDNKLGRDIFVFYIYNQEQRPTICPDEMYDKYHITNGIHFGGFDKCGVPHDAHPYHDLFAPSINDGCHFESSPSPMGVGVGAACSALIKASGWTIDKIYPW